MTGVRRTHEKINCEPTVQKGEIAYYESKYYLSESCEN